MSKTSHENNKESFEINKDKPVLLLGEGKDEFNFFTGLVKHLGLTASIQIAQYAGKPNLSAFLSTLSAQTGFPSLRTIGITCDADDDHSATLASVNHSIQQVNFPEHIKVKTYILPGEDKSGALEALVLEAAESSPAWNCVERFTKCVAPNDKPSLSSAQTDKRRMHAWLSTLSKPELRLGEAALKHHIHFGHQAFKPITDFLTSLVPVTKDQ
ncbi:MAG: hypothetical protein PHG96_07400 [Kiritimatiellae bacterium]|nr:hypothetical protein [Kiritimatiellia bacterium]